jgi:hypothetical protein
MTAPTFDEWLLQGVTLGFCSPVVCETHDGVGLTVEQEEEFNQGFDPCLHVVQVFEDRATQRLVFENHSPFQYRASEEMKNAIQHP